MIKKSKIDDNSLKFKKDELENTPTASRRHFLVGSLSSLAVLTDCNSSANAKPNCRATEKSIVGPFHRPAAPFRNKLVSDEEPGDRLILSGTVFGPSCERPIANALLDFWQADGRGHYDMPKYLSTYTPNQEYRLRGQLLTDKDGRYSLETIIPGRYKIPEGLPNVDEKFAGQIRPAHIHLSVVAPGYASLITQLYFKGDPYITKDPWAGKSQNNGPSKNQLELKDGNEKNSFLSNFDIFLDQA